MARELSVMLDERSQFLPTITAIGIRVNSCFELCDAALAPTQARHELVLVNRAFGVAVNKPFNAPLQFAELEFQLSGSSSSPPAGASCRCSNSSRSGFLSKLHSSFQTADSINSPWICGLSQIRSPPKR